MCGGAKPSGRIYRSDLMLDKSKASTQAQPLKKGDRVFLVDGSSFVFRAYFQ